MAMAWAASANTRIARLFLAGGEDIRNFNRVGELSGGLVFTFVCLLHVRHGQSIEFLTSYLLFALPAKRFQNVSATVMMDIVNQRQFQQQYQSLWEDLEKTCSDDGKSPDMDNFVQRYRRLCYSYALAGSRHYNQELLQRLHRLVMICHQRLYSVAGKKGRFRQFIWRDFPHTLRRNAGFFWLGTVLFYAPFFIVGILCYIDPEWIYGVMSERQVVNFEMMYGPAREVLGRTRDSDTDIFMFGFYIRHNIGIGFRTFAGGLSAGLLTVAGLLFNGETIGAVAGYLSRQDYAGNFWSFVVGHSAFELTAITICGAAGLKLAHGIWAPGRLSRKQALQAAARPTLIMAMGAALMLVIAAFIEAFWSSRILDPAVKYSVGGGLWVLIIGYLTLAGRR